MVEHVDRDHNIKKGIISKHPISKERIILGYDRKWYVYSESEEYKSFWIWVSFKSKGNFAYDITPV